MVRIKLFLVVFKLDGWLSFFLFFVFFFGGGGLFRAIIFVTSVTFRFYTLLVISTALFDEPPFKNLIVSGLVLAE